MWKIEVTLTKPDGEQEHNTWEYDSVSGDATADAGNDVELWLDGELGEFDDDEDDEDLDEDDEDLDPNGDGVEDDESDVPVGHEDSEAGDIPGTGEDVDESTLMDDFGPANDSNKG